MITINPNGLDNWIEMLDTFPDRAREAMAVAINQTAKREAAKSIRDDMLKQVNLKKGYLIKHTPVHAFATKNKLKATITARDTPTMLARYAMNRTRIPKRQKGVKVQVRRGSIKNMKSAFLVDFSGKAKTNVALMVRTKNGQPPHGVTHDGARYVKSMNAWILYAPSIDQLMWSVAGQNEAKITRALEREFLRQFALRKGK